MSFNFTEWLENVKKDVGEPVVDFDTHKPTANERNNLCYLSMKYLCGWQMRGADFSVAELMGGKPETVAELSERYIPQLAEYIWDHLMGEPDEPTVEQMTEGVGVVRDMLFAMDEETRNAV